MTRQDHFFKWLLYALGVLPIWLLETTVLNRVPLFGVIPVLLPLAAVAAAFWEGPVSGGAFGLCLGVVADAIYPGVPGGMAIGLTVLAVLTGMCVRGGLKQNFFNCLLCSAGAMALLELVRLLWGVPSGLGTLPQLLPVAWKELLWSLAFTLPIYALFKAIHRRTARMWAKG